jgi:hypothetical protein
VISITLPSNLWRIAVAVGLPVGIPPEVAREVYDAPGWGSLYLVGLSLVITGFALLTFGLVRPWGEEVPRWVPAIGGKRIAPPVVLIPAGIGAIAATALWGPVAVLWWTQGDPGETLTATGHTLVGLLYLPMAAWGPLLGYLAVSYHRRRRNSPKEPRTEPEPA